MDDHDVDAAFEAIIAGWEPVPLPADLAPEPDLPTPPPDPDPGPAVAADPLTGWRVHPPLPRPESGEPSAQASAADADPFDADDEEHFVPEPVHLPPQEDLHFWGIVVGLVTGPLLLLWVVFAGGGANASWWLLLAVLLTVGGFALLVLRQPAHRDPGDDDNGARL